MRALTGIRRAAVPQEWVARLFWAAVWLVVLTFSSLLGWYVGSGADVADRL